MVFRHTGCLAYTGAGLEVMDYLQHLIHLNIMW